MWMFFWLLYTMYMTSCFHYLLSTKINILKMWHSNAVRHRKISLVTISDTGVVKIAKYLRKLVTGHSNPEGNQHIQQQDLCSYLNAIKPNLASRCKKLEYQGGCKQQLMSQYSCRKFFTEGKSRRKKNQNKKPPSSQSIIQLAFHNWSTRTKTEMWIFSLVLQTWE